MAGSRNVRWRSGVTLAVITAYFLAPEGTTPAQGQPAPGVPSIDYASMLDAEAPRPAMPGLRNGPQPGYGPGPNAGRFEARVEMGLFDTITESLFGDVY